MILKGWLSWVSSVEQVDVHIGVFGGNLRDVCLVCAQISVKRITPIFICINIVSLFSFSRYD